MRIEQNNNRYILCGVIIPADRIKAGQVWMGSSGGIVTVESVDDNSWVTYSWDTPSGKQQHTKMQFAFQCRYCLVLGSTDIPEWLK